MNLEYKHTNCALLPRRLRPQRANTSKMSSTENNEISFGPSEFPLIVTDKGKYKWQGDYKALQNFSEDVLKMKGKWSSPGGNVKLLKTDELVLRWYTTSNNITINGLKAEDIRKKLKSYATNVSNSTESPNQNDVHWNELDNNSAINERSCQTPLSSNNNERFDSLEDTVEILKTQLVSLRFQYQGQRSEATKEIDEAHTECLREENEKLKEENIALNERINNLGFILADLNTKLKISEEEKASLLTSIRLIQSDIEYGCKTPPTEVDKNEITVQTKSTLEENRVKSPNLNRILGSNRYYPLTVEDTLKETELPSSPSTTHNNSDIKTTKSPSSKHRNSDTKPMKSTRGDQDSITILGDSMIKRLDVRRIHRSVGNNKQVHICTFSGACIEDMDHYVKPLLSKNPKKVIIHAGTNNIPTDEPESTVSKTSKLGDYIERTSNAKVIISSIIVRNDDRLNPKIEVTNDMFKNVCATRKWQFIQNSNISKTDLNASGLHLSASGTSLLAKNFIACMKD